jgi:hypothetical protein
MKIRQSQRLALTLAILAFGFFGCSEANARGIEIRVTHAERDDTTCSFSGGISNQTDNHLNALSLDNNDIVSDMTANSQSSEDTALLSIELKGNQTCSGVVLALRTGARKPFISKCDMAGVNEGDCQRLVHFNFAISPADMAAVFAADGQAQAAVAAEQRLQAAQRKKQTADAATLASGLPVLGAAIVKTPPRTDTESERSRLDDRIEVYGAAGEVEWTVSPGDKVCVVGGDKGQVKIVIPQGILYLRESYSAALTPDTNGTGCDKMGPTVVFGSNSIPAYGDNGGLVANLVPGQRVCVISSSANEVRLIIPQGVANVRQAYSAAFRPAPDGKGCEKGL